MTDSRKITEEEAKVIRIQELENALKEALRLIDPMLPAYIAESDFFTEKENRAQLRTVNQFIARTKTLLGQK